MNDGATDQQIDDYAARTSVAVNFVKRRLRQGKKLAVSMMGFPVEYKRRVWGVIIIDSIKNDGIIDKSDLYDTILTTQTILQALARRL